MHQTSWFLLLQKTDHGYRLGESCTPTLFHGTSFQNIQKLMYFVTHQQLPQNHHSLSQFAVDMLEADELYTPKNTSLTRNINGLYHPQMSKSDVENYRCIKIKVGRKSQKRRCRTFGIHFGPKSKYSVSFGSQLSLDIQRYTTFLEYAS